MTPEFREAISRALIANAKFPPAAYHLVRESLDKVLTEVRAKEASIRHVSGSEICDGLRRHLLTEFGPMAADVLEDANIHCTRDVGEVVFLLIDAGYFSRSDEDQIADFEECFAFDDAFRAPFRAGSKSFSTRSGLDSPARSHEENVRFGTSSESPP